MKNTLTASDEQVVSAFSDAVLAVFESVGSLGFPSKEQRVKEQHIKGFLRTL